MIGNILEFKYYNNGEKNLILAHIGLGDNLKVITFQPREESKESMIKMVELFYESLPEIDKIKPKNITNENY